MPSAGRLVVIGLDCASPDLLFGSLASAMPNLTQLRKRGVSAALRAPWPPITVPSWASMMTGRSPGELGVYGFRNRVQGSYGMRLAEARDIRHKYLWDYAAEQGRRVASLFVPPSYPPRPTRGVSASCFLTPPGASDFCFPASVGAELQARFGPYMPDLDGFREGDRSREAQLQELCRMTEQHFDMALYLFEHEAPDLLVMVEIGTDRLHHLAWDQLDEKHPRFDKESPLARLARNYYARIDQHLGRFAEQLGPSDTLLIVSDHGAQTMQGAVRLNEWFRQAGLLRLRATLQNEQKLSAETVDWSRTKAWAEGGYHGRVMLNLKGREPEGIVAPEDYERTRDEVAKVIAALPEAYPLLSEVEVRSPESLYREVRGLPPDLMVVFSNLAYRVTSEVGGEATGDGTAGDGVSGGGAASDGRSLGGIVQQSSGVGFDLSNHAWDGVFIAVGPRFRPTSRTASESAKIHESRTCETLQGRDVLPIALEALGLSAPSFCGSSPFDMDSRG